MLKLAILLTISGIAFGQDCKVNFNISAAGATTPVDNRTLGCRFWEVFYFTDNNVSAISLQFESANDNGGRPATFAAFAGTLTSGTNPSTSTTSQDSTFTGLYAWVRVNVTSMTGGSVTGAMWGWKQAAVNFSSNGGKGFGTLIPVNTGSFSWVNQGNATATSLGNGSVMLQIPTGNAAAPNAHCFAWNTALTSLTPPWTIQIAIQPYAQHYNSGDFDTGGLAFLDGSNNLLMLSIAAQTATGQSFGANGIYLCPASGGQPNIGTCTGIDTNSYSTPQDLIFMAFRWDGTKYDWSISPDGQSVANGTFPHISAFWNNTLPVGFGTLTKACLLIAETNNNYAGIMNYLSFAQYNR